jgi:endonuclease YncB( thermonuclease family)
MAQVLHRLGERQSAQPGRCRNLDGAFHEGHGDTIVVSGVPIRLQGVAAPELREKWGRASKKAMQRLTAGQRLRCELTGEKTHDREVGVCYLDDGTNIGAAIIAEGLARNCPRYPGGRYAKHETEQSRTLPFPGYCRRR